MEKQVPKERSQQEASAVLARCLSVLYTELLKVGFTEAYAFQLVQTALKANGPYYK